MEEQYIPLIQAAIYAGAGLLAVLGTVGGCVISNCIRSKYKNKHAAENTRAQNELEQSQSGRTKKLLEDSEYKNLLRKREDYAREQIEKWQADERNDDPFPPDLEETLDAIFGELSH